jgi:hypothetical protein
MNATGTGATNASSRRQKVRVSRVRCDPGGEISSIDALDRNRILDMVTPFELVSLLGWDQRR